MSVSDLLQFLAAGRKTGTLKFGRGNIVKQIYLEDGLIIGANTNDPKEYLGQVLIHYGKLNEEQLQIGMEIQRESGGRLGEILVKKGFLDQATVLETLRIRTLDIIYDLFMWEEAHFEFYDFEPLPSDLIRIEIEPQAVIMEGICRMDELTRYGAVIPSDRAVLQLAPGWTSSINLGKEVRQILFFVEKGMTVAEICYNMHTSPFHIYGQLFDLAGKGIVRVVGEAPEAPLEVEHTVPALGPEEILNLARKELQENNGEEALTIIHELLQREPKNDEAQNLLVEAEKSYINKIYSDVSPKAVPTIVATEQILTQHQFTPQEGFVLSRINGEWDIQSILAVCPFREADSLKMIKKLLDNGIIGF